MEGGFRRQIDRLKTRHVPSFGCSSPNNGPKRPGTYHRLSRAVRPSVVKVIKYRTEAGLEENLRLENTVDGKRLLVGLDV